MNLNYNFFFCFIFYSAEKLYLCKRKNRDMEIKDLKIVDRRSFHPVTEALGMLSHELEYKLTNPNSHRKLITEQETYDKLRDIINLYNKI